jgi:membrane-bound lytic murein transglycosylase D
MSIKSMKFIERLLLFVMLTFAAVGVVTIFAYSSEKAEVTDENIPPKIGQYSVKAIKVPGEVSFAGERMPVENFDVRESLDKELHKVCYWHSETFLYIKRAHRFFPVIEKILKLHNVPDDFKYLALGESGLENVTSPAGAKGYWQFLSDSGKEYGLEINSQVDERYHLEKSTAAACQYLKKLRKKYGSWALAAAAYNNGQGNLDKQISRQGQNNYYDLLLNSETARYLYRITAIKLIMQQSEKYGFILDEDDYYKPLTYKTVVLDSTVNDFAEYARMQGTNYKLLKEYNPWLRSNELKNASGKKYTLKIPESNSRSGLYE